MQALVAGWLACRFAALLALAAVGAGCSTDARERPKAVAWLELAGDPDASPAELSAALHASLPADARAALERLASEASRISGQPMSGVDMIRFEGLAPGLRVRALEVTPDGRLALTIDRVTGVGPKPERVVFELGAGAEGPGIVVPGIAAGGTP